MLLQKRRGGEPFIQRNSLQTKSAFAFSGPPLGCTEQLRSPKSSVHPSFADPFAFRLDVLFDIRVTNIPHCINKIIDRRQRPMRGQKGCVPWFQLSLPSLEQPYYLVDVRNVGVKTSEPERVDTREKNAPEKRRNIIYSNKKG